MMNPRNFAEFFKKAAGDTPFPFQRDFAEAPSLPQLVRVPTGLGKTAMAVVGWLWRRHGATDKIKAETPRRLVYCLPMRVLVEQTRDCASLWLQNLKLLGGTADFEEREGKKVLRSYTPDGNDPGKVAVHVLMGGEDEDDWDIFPERDAILIGTQDMLLSRALNRGYAATRSRWPMQFGLLHTDCLWIFDEIQLMGAGLATTAQMEAFRHLVGSKDGHHSRSVWMSATMQRDWLKTVDFGDRVKDLSSIELTEDDRKIREIEKRWGASKSLDKAESRMGDAVGIAKEVREAHRPGTRTIVVVNTVQRACELFEALEGKKTKRAGASPPVQLVLLHSRFRPADRDRELKRALNAPPPAGGTIVVSTQVIEAGVDVSAMTLFTELAPWASLVQRFGRCNRRGEHKSDARVVWIDLAKENAEALTQPYDPEQLEQAATQLRKYEKAGVGPSALTDVGLPFDHTHVIRRKDMIDLFDTTPDLAGNDIDVDRFVREVEDSDVRVFWRDWDRPEPPPETIRGPRREELCSAPVGKFRDFLKKRRGSAWRWSFLDGAWEKANSGRIAPGQVFLLHSEDGGYRPETGWDPTSLIRVEPIALPEEGDTEPPDSHREDAPSRGVWQTIAEHADETCKEINAIVTALPFACDEANALRQAARWHDRGKAHDVFRNALPEGAPRTAAWAKAPGTWKQYERKRFRHELASALAVLDPRNGQVDEEMRDLIAYLVAAHHGKVRMSIRSLPEERRPDPRDGGKAGARRFARGVWDDDELPETDLGGGLIAPRVKMSLEPMELGLCESEPFRGRPSWAERVIHLRDTLGPFHLAYLEAVLRAADWRASARARKEP